MQHFLSELFEFLFRHLTGGYASAIDTPKWMNNSKGTSPRHGEQRFIFWFYTIFIVVFVGEWLLWDFWAALAVTAITYLAAFMFVRGVACWINRVPAAEPDQDET